MNLILCSHAEAKVSKPGKECEKNKQGKAEFRLKYSVISTGYALGLIGTCTAVSELPNHL